MQIKLDPEDKGADRSQLEARPRYEDVRVRQRTEEIAKRSDGEALSLFE